MGASVNCLCCIGIIAFSETGKDFHVVPETYSDHMPVKVRMISPESDMNESALQRLPTNPRVNSKRDICKGQLINKLEELGKLPESNEAAAAAVLDN